MLPGLPIRWIVRPPRNPDRHGRVYLLGRRRRFNESKRQVGSVMQQMLTKPLHEDELTEAGESLRSILKSLEEWGEWHALGLLAALGEGKSSR